MQENYWTKNPTRQEIITKTQILNRGNFNISANYYNLIDVKRLGFQLSSNADLEVEKMYRKNRFEYFVLKHNNQKEQHILQEHCQSPTQRYNQSFVKELVKPAQATAF
jgi:hypothetical protein